MAPVPNSVRIAALEVENGILRAALEDIKEQTDPDPQVPAEGYGEDDMNYRGDDREGCLDFCFATAKEALESAAADDSKGEVG